MLSRLITKIVSAAVCAPLFVSSSLIAQTAQWNLPGQTGDWENSDHWFPLVIPDGGPFTVNIDNSSTVIVNESIEVSTVNFQDVGLIRGKVQVFPQASLEISPVVSGGFAFGSLDVSEGGTFSLGANDADIRSTTISNSGLILSGSDSLMEIFANGSGIFNESIITQGATGIIRADGASSRISLRPTSLTGGRVEANNGGVVGVEGGVFDGVTFSASGGSFQNQVQVSNNITLKNIEVEAQTLLEMSGNVSFEGDVALEGTLAVSDNSGITFSDFGNNLTFSGNGAFRNGQSSTPINIQADGIGGTITIAEGFSLEGAFNLDVPFMDLVNNGEVRFLGAGNNSVSVGAGLVGIDPDFINNGTVFLGVEDGGNPVLSTGFANALSIDNRGVFRLEDSSRWRLSSGSSGAFTFVQQNVDPDDTGRIELAGFSVLEVASSGAEVLGGEIQFADFASIEVSAGAVFRDVTFVGALASYAIVNDISFSTTEPALLFEGVTVPAGLAIELDGGMMEWAGTNTIQSDIDATANSNHWVSPGTATWTGGGIITDTGNELNPVNQNLRARDPQQSTTLIIDDGFSYVANGSVGFSTPLNIVNNGFMGASSGTLTFSIDSSTGAKLTNNSEISAVDENTFDFELDFFQGEYENRGLIRVEDGGRMRVRSVANPTLITNTDSSTQAQLNARGVDSEIQITGANTTLISQDILIENSSKLTLDDGIIQGSIIEISGPDAVFDPLSGSYTIENSQIILRDGPALTLFGSNMGTFTNVNWVVDGPLESNPFSPRFFVFNDTNEVFDGGSISVTNGGRVSMTAPNLTLKNMSLTLGAGGPVASSNLGISAGRVENSIFFADDGIFQVSGSDTVLQDVSVLTNNLLGPTGAFWFEPGGSQGGVIRRFGVGLANEVQLRDGYYGFAEDMVSVDGTIRFQGTEDFTGWFNVDGLVLNGTGTIFFDNPLSFIIANDNDAAGASLTIEADLTIQGTGELGAEGQEIELVNKGAIVATTGGMFIDVLNEPVDNDGTIQATTGFVSILGGVNNSGTLDAEQDDIGITGDLETSGDVLIGNGSRFDANALTVENGLLVVDGALFTVAGVDFLEGTLEGNGTINAARVDVGSIGRPSVLAPGRGAGNTGFLTVNAPLMLNQGLVVDIDITGAPDSSMYDYIDCGQSVTVAGTTLVVELLNDYSPSPTDSFPIVRADSGSVSGSLLGGFEGDPARVVALRNGMEAGTFRIVQTSTRIELTDFEAAEVLVDSDMDDLPDAWELEHFGDLSQGPLNDFDADGVLNIIEYALGLNPTEFSASPLSIQIREEQGSEFAYVLFSRVKELETNISIDVLVGLNSLILTDNQSDFTDSIPLDDQGADVQNAEFKYNTPLTDEIRRLFFALRVTGE